MIWSLSFKMLIASVMLIRSLDTIEEALSVKIIENNFFSDLQVIKLRVALESTIL